MDKESTAVGPFLILPDVSPMHTRQLIRTRRPTGTSGEYFNGKQWVVMLSDGTEAAGRQLQQARETAARIISGEFFPMSGRIVDVRV